MGFFLLDIQHPILTDTLSNNKLFLIPTVPLNELYQVDQLLRRLKRLNVNRHDCCCLIRLIYSDKQNNRRHQKMKNKKNITFSLSGHKIDRNKKIGDKYNKI